MAEPLGLDLERAAYSVLAVANEHMVTAIKDITINEGLDPRASIVVGGGGAGGMTIARIAEQLGCRRVLIPRTAGALSATRRSVLRRRHRVLDQPPRGHEPLRLRRGQRGARAARRTDRRVLRPSRQSAEQRRKEFFVEARYPYQVWELEVPLGAGSFADDGDVERMVEAFHDVHERVFAVKEPGQHVECIYWKGRATAALPKPPLPHFEANGAGPPTRSGLREASFGIDGAVDAPIYLGSTLSAGQRLSGPAIVEEPTTTVVVNPGWSRTVTATGDYLLEQEGIQA